MPGGYGQNEPRRGRGIVTAILVVLCLVLMTGYAREGQAGPLHSIQRGAAGVVAPFSSVGSHLGSVAEGAEQALGNAAADDATLAELREQNEQLRRLLADAEEYRLEAERLRALLDMRQVSGVSGMAAHIIGRSTTAWDQSVTIDVGTRDGVDAGMAVMGATGLVGQVVAVSETTAQVRLLTDPNSGTAVKIQSSRANAVVRGSLEGRLYLEDVEEDEIPQVGDVVITSGLGGSYASGLLVGTVVSVGRTSANATGSIIVNPNDRATLQEEVLVVMDASVVSEAQVAPGEQAREGQATAAGADADEADEGESAGEGAADAAATALEEAVEAPVDAGDEAAQVAQAAQAAQADQAPESAEAPQEG